MPYALWRSYGDRAVIRDSFPSMQRFLEYVKNKAGPGLIEGSRSHYGDWLNVNDPTSGLLLGTAVYYRDVTMMAEMARAIGETKDADVYDALADDIREAFDKVFIGADGSITWPLYFPQTGTGESQTGYALAIGYGLVPDDMLAKVGAKFAAKLAASNNHLTTGFLGTPWLLPALSAIGRDDLAWTLLMNKDYPSWGYEIEMGATTMWERWDAIGPDGVAAADNESLNHYAYGAVVTGCIATRGDAPSRRATTSSGSPLVPAAG